MDRKQFIERVRSGSASFRVDDVTIHFPDAETSGHGILNLTDRGLEIHLRLPADASPPKPKGGVLTRADSGLMRGVIDHDLRFEVKNVFPSFHYSTENGRTTMRYRIDAIELAAVGLDTQTYDQIQRRLAQLESAETEFDPDEGISSEKGSHGSNVTFSGLLLGFKLIARNAGTEIKRQNPFLGESTSSSSDTQYGDLSEGWEYGLIERGEDVEFHLRLKDGANSVDTNNDLKALQAFMEAIAFIHGQHAWPFSLEFHRDHKLITDRVRPPKVALSSVHRPFNERIWFNSAVANVQWDFNTALGKAFTFLSVQNELTAEVTRLLFLIREAAGRGTHTTITNIAMCSLLDSAVNLVFEEKIQRRETETIGAFNQVRSKLLAWIHEQSMGPNSPKNPAWDRFETMIKNAEFYAAREKFRLVGKYLGFKWEGDWQVIFRFWARWRPKLVHRGSSGDDSADSVAEQFNIGSRVVGAIHMLVLKLMGYEGLMVNSTFEDKVRTI
jgi:hypothetical protein